MGYLGCYKIFGEGEDSVNNRYQRRIQLLSAVMKPSSHAVLCLSLLLLHAHFSLAKRVGGGAGKSSFGKKIPSPPNRGTNTQRRPNQGTNNQPGNYPRQPQNPQQPGGNPQQPGGFPMQPGGYPQQPGRGGFYNQGGYPQQPGRPGYPNQGGYGGGYMNQNPNNHILSPGYGSSYGYGGYGSVGGSPFSRSVQGMGLGPSQQSRGFGRNAAMAAGAGVVAGMALGYGLGRFPRPHFHFHNPQEEYYYNHYMYKKYGRKSTDQNDYSRDYQFSPPPQSYDNYMGSCMKRTDLLRGGKNAGSEKGAREKLFPLGAPDTPNTQGIQPTGGGIAVGENREEQAPDRGSSTSMTNAGSTPAPGSGPGNISATEAILTAGNITAMSEKPLTPQSNPPPPPVEDHLLPNVPEPEDDDDEDTVSISEIGYPALIEQMKARRCVELYMVYSERFMQIRKPEDEKNQPRGRPTGGGDTLSGGHQALMTVLSSTALLLLNSNLLLLQ